MVTIKFKGHEDYARLEQLKNALAAQCGEFFLMRLSANKNEACAFGVAGASQFQDSRMRVENAKPVTADFPLPSTGERD